MCFGLWQSVLPDRALHNLPSAEEPVVLCKVQNRASQDTEVENLVACATEVKSAGRASFRTTHHVDNCALNVYVAAKSVDPRQVGSHVRGI